MKTSEAFRQLLRCHAAITVNTWRAVNRAVHRCPWLFITAAVMASAAVSYANIGSARAERDHANREMAAMMDTIATYRAVVDNKVYLNK